MKKLLILMLTTLITQLAFAKRPLIIGMEGAYFPDSFCGTFDNPQNCPDALGGVIKKGATTGGINGFDVRIAEAICEKLDRECRYKIVPWGKSDQNNVPAIFHRNDIDLIIAAATRRPERVKAFGPTSIRYSTDAPIRFVAKTCWSDYKPESLRGKTLISQSGTIYDIFLKKHYEPQGVTVISFSGTAEEMMDEITKNPNIDGALVGFNGFPPKWVLDNKYYVIKPTQAVHPEFTSNYRGSFVYVHRYRLFQRNKILDKINSAIARLWAESLESPDSDSVLKFERDFQRGVHNPDWQKIVNSNCKPK